MNPLAARVLLGAVTALVRARFVVVAPALVAARHPDSDGGRRLTVSERRDLVRAILFGIANLEEGDP